jgi:23S rRNA (uracil1939-C5)-methyltransferase
MTAPGTILTLHIERPAVGGRMIARHEGAVVLVAGAIPGERVTARVERVQRRTVWARVVEVLDRSPDRVDPDAGVACGGNVLAHLSAARQTIIKAEMLADAFRRIGRVDLPGVPVVPSPPEGYRTRARVHVRAGRWGFFEEGSHRLCDVRGSRQMSTPSAEIVDRLCAAVVRTNAGVSAEIEWAETADGAGRAAHITLEKADGKAMAALGLVAGLDSASWSAVDREKEHLLWGDVHLVDRIDVAGQTGVPVLHHARSFFQGNRHLLQPLVSDVLERVTGTRVLDLYAGVGLFSVAAVTAGKTVMAVEGHATAADDLRRNAAARPEALRYRHNAVEEELTLATAARADTVIVDPPRTGLSAEVSRALAAGDVPRIVYVSCDPATLARDVRVLVDGGYKMSDVRAYDLFPRTAHVETVLTLDRRELPRAPQCWGTGRARGPQISPRGDTRISTAAVWDVGETVAGVRAGVARVLCGEIGALAGALCVSPLAP